MKSIKILAGITLENELYFLEINPMSEDRTTQKYFSMGGFTVKPMLLSEAHEEVRTSLEDGEMWKQAVEAGKTELGLKEWAEHVIDTDGNLAGFDNSLYPEAVTVDGEEYIFRSESCGQHVENVLKRYFINHITYSKLLAIWDKYHLKEVETGQIFARNGDDSLQYMLENMEKQNVKGLIMQAITIIKNEE